MLLAWTLSRLGREAEADSLYRAIIHDPDDPYHWHAAGELCGEERAIVEYPLCEWFD
jgi:hypothetical protein